MLSFCCQSKGLGVSSDEWVHVGSFYIHQIMCSSLQSNYATDYTQVVWTASSTSRIYIFHLLNKATLYLMLEGSTAVLFCPNQTLLEPLSKWHSRAFPTRECSKPLETEAVGIPKKPEWPAHLGDQFPGSTWKFPACEAQEGKRDFLPRCVL